jgi:DNA-binding transcriptional LysR family regulator
METDVQDLRGLLVFARVVEALSFSRAAEQLGVTKSAVSKQVAQLEAQLGVQLLSRTTRKLSLTDVGERVYTAAKELLATIEAARDAAHDHGATMMGHLRIAAPAVLGRSYIAPWATAFLREHVQLSMELVLGDAFLDLVESRIDVAVRVGRVADASLVSRKVTRVDLAVCASPSYLAEHGAPTVPEDFEKHEWVQHTPFVQESQLTLLRGRRSVTVPVRGRLNCNDGAGGVRAAVEGFCLVVAPEFELCDEVRSGRLVRVAGNFQLPQLDLQVVFPPRRHVSSKVRAWVEFISTRLKEAPWRLAP